MKKSFENFWQKRLAFFRLGIVSNLEYRLNYFSDAIIQPILAASIELTLWYAVFRVTATQSIGGYPLESYVGYALWGSFIARIASNWMYEFRMIGEIETGSVNSLIVRPTSFYEYYLYQFAGYKVITTVLSMTIPFAVTFYLGIPVHYERMPLVFAMVLYYVLLLHTMSFCVACLAFRFNRVGSFTVAKNFVLWMFSGELFPLDLLPEPFRNWMVLQPFSCAVYLPAGYLMGRVDYSIFERGFLSLTCGLIFFAFLGRYLWTSGLRNYTGQGA